MGLQDVNVDTVVEAAVANQSSGGSSSPQTDSSAPSGQNNSQAAGKTVEEILNLDGAQKFKFGDREWTPDQLRKSIMMHSDYTKKTQKIAETSKYWDNLDADLEYVRGNPKAVEQFLQTYPKQFHKYLSAAGVKMQQMEAENLQQQSRAEIPPEILKDLQMVKNYVQEKETQAIEAQLDQTFATLSKKYPEGDEDIVLARAQALLDAKRETDPGFRITNEVWEKLWKASHEKTVSKLAEKQKGILNNQRQANTQARGPAPGGGTPGQAPVRMNLKQATEHAVQTLSGRKG